MLSSAASSTLRARRRSQPSHLAKGRRKASVMAEADPRESAWRRNEAKVACSSADCTSGSGRRNRRNDSVKLVGRNTAPPPSSSEDDGDFDLAALDRFEGIKQIEKLEALSST